MDYPTPDEEYELMYGEELQMMDDFEESANVADKPSVSTQKPKTNNNKDMSIMSSPALSQISRHGFNFTPEHGANKKTSTPFMDKLKALQTKESEPASSALVEIQNIGVKRKRRLEDLFGDIYDIAEDDEDNYLKKQKTEEERDYETIERIIAARKTFQTQVNPLKNTNYDRLEALHKFKKENLSRTIPKYPFITISKDNERLYVRNHSEEFESMKLSEIKAFDRNRRNLLGLEREEIFQQANDLILKGVSASQAPAIEAQPVHVNDSVDLWVEKYRPKKYIDLLSEESTNRSLLQWLKLWDKVVFKREKPLKVAKRAFTAFVLKTKASFYFLVQDFISWYRCSSGFFPVLEHIDFDEATPFPLL